MGEQKAQCTRTVYPKEAYGAFHGYRCTRSAIEDGKCAIHCKSAEDRRRAKSNAIWELRVAEANRESIAKIRAAACAAACAGMDDPAKGIERLRDAERQHSAYIPALTDRMLEAERERDSLREQRGRLHGALRDAVALLGGINSDNVCETIRDALATVTK